MIADAMRRFLAPRRLVRWSRLPAVSFLWVGWVLSLPTAIVAQTVTGVDGANVTFSAATALDAVPGDQAKLCRNQDVAGRATRICSAVLRVQSIEGNRGTGVLVKGDVGAIQVGMAVVLERRPAPAPNPGKARRVNPDDPADQLRAGDEAFAAARWAEAILRYERLLVLVPGDPYAIQKLEEARAGERDANFRAEVRARRQKESAKVAYLESSLERSTAAGELDAAGSYARMMLEIDPFEPRALAVRENARAEVKAKADPLAERWDWDGFQLAWGGFAETWSDPSAKEQAAAEAQARIEGVFAAWAGRTCRELPQVFATISQSLRSEPRFLAFAEERIRSAGCRILGRLLAPGELPGAALSAIVARGGPGSASTTLEAFIEGSGAARPSAQAELELSGETPIVLLVPGGSTVRVAHGGTKEKDRPDRRDSWQGTLPPGSEVELCAESTSNPLKKVVGRRVQVKVCTSS